MLRPANKPHAVETWVHAGAVLFALFFLSASLYISVHRLFWYDEVFTTLTTRLPDWSTMWKALVHDNYDPMPFGYFVIARIFDQMFGPGEIGIRLPSALAVAAGMLLTYDAARRISNGLHGMIAMAALSCSLLPYYASEGRAYGLFFFVAALAVWAWITDRSAIVFGAIFLVGVLIHYYMVLCLVPFVMEEIYSWRRERKLRPRILAGVAGAVVATGVLAPQILASRRVYGASFWAAPSFAKMPQVITDLFPAGLILIALAFLWTLLMDRRKMVTPPPMTATERTCWFFLLIPIAAFLMAKLVTHAFTSRYLIGVLPGVAVGLSALLWRRFHEMQRVSVGILVLLGGYGAFLQLNAAIKVDRIPAFGPAQERTKTMLEMEDQLWAEGKKYIVIPDQHLLFLEARYYSHHPERYVIATDRPVTPALHYPMATWGPDEIRQHFREAAFVEPRYEVVEMMKHSQVRAVLRFPGIVPVFYME